MPGNDPTEILHKCNFSKLLETLSCRFISAIAIATRSNYRVRLEVD